MKTKKYKLPVNYNDLDWFVKIKIREQYIEEQNGLCMYCQCSLSEPAPDKITNKLINWKLFPKGFLDYPVHLQHDHKTGMTEGAVHNYCNAVLWQYEGR